MVFSHNMLQKQEFDALARKNAYAQLLNKENFANRPVWIIRLNYHSGRLLPPNLMINIEIFLDSQAIFKLKSVPAVIVHCSFKQVCFESHLPHLVLYSMRRFI